MLLACLTIVPIALLHCLWASAVYIGIAGLRNVFFSRLCELGSLRCRWQRLGRVLVVLLHSFLSLASRPICISPALDIGGLSCVIVVVSCFGLCIGQMCVATAW